jgi:hypothetical protein
MDAMSDLANRFDFPGAVLAEQEEPIWLAESAQTSSDFLPPLVAAAPAAPEPTTLEYAAPENPNNIPSEPAMRDILSSDDDDAVVPYFDDAVQIDTAAGAPADVGGNGIFVPYEAPASFVGLDAVGALPAV